MWVTPDTSIASLLSVGARMAPVVPTYAPRDPSGTVLYHVIAEHLETFLASLADDPEAAGLPAYVAREFYDYLRCGILAHGFLRLGCDTCHHELLVPFSCQFLAQKTHPYTSPEKGRKAVLERLRQRL